MTPRRAFLALSLVAFAASAAAASPSPSTRSSSASSSQTSSIPVDPAAIAFDVSADHDAEDFAGPKLLKYVIEFVPVVGAQGTAYTLDLGKPKPVQSQITVPLTKVLLPGTYLAHVRAIGRGLTSAATTTGPFTITEKTGKTKAEYDKEMRARQQADERRDKQNKKLKVPRDTPVPPEAEAEKDGGKGGKDPKEGAKPDGKGGFWKKFYGKVVG
jgi:hypothetical protein